MHRNFDSSTWINPILLLVLSILNNVEWSNPLSLVFSNIEPDNYIV